MKDLVVTTISSNYEWSEIRNWICSLKDTGYSGDILVLAYNFVDTTHLYKLQEMGAIVITPTVDYRGNEETNWIWHSGQVNTDNAHKLIHNVRLFHLWLYLGSCNEAYKHIIFTDSRDVYFQSNPSDWFSPGWGYEILVPSEGVLYHDQSWNANNMITNYGIYAMDHMGGTIVRNVGTFACSGTIARDLLFTMYLMSKDTGHADQPSFNILAFGLLRDKCMTVSYQDSWAFQIGAIVETWSNYCEIKNDIIYPIRNKVPFVIVHQYDRIPELKQMIDKRYAGR